MKNIENIFENIPTHLLEKLSKNAAHKKIIFPETNDLRIKAASDILTSDFKIEVLKPEWNFQKEVQQCSELVATEKNKEPKILPSESLNSPFFQSGALVALGIADAAIGGAVSPTSNVIRAALSTIGLSAQTSVLSSVFLMLLKNPTLGGISEICISDAGVIPNPTEKELSEIALLCSEVYKKWMFKSPMVSFLSFSTAGSAEHESVTKVRNAATRFRHMCPSVKSEGEVQMDSAIDPEVCLRKNPESCIRGESNVLIFPDLNSANIAYKTMQKIGGAIALGPVLTGLKKPYSDLSRGCSIQDICLVSLLTLSL
jgi:phosphate acetyltransferase